MSNNQDYNNFNNYTEQPQQPQQPVMQQPYVQPQYIQLEQPKPSPVWGILSIILGVFGFCCYGVPSLLGLIFGIVGVVKNKRSVASIVGIVICAMAVLFWVYCLVMIVANPEIWEQALQMAEEMTGQSL